MRDFPKYVVCFQTEYDDERMTPQQAAIEAMREVQGGEVYADVYDIDSKRRWCAKFHEHVLEVIETRDVEFPTPLPGLAPWREVRQ